MRHTYTHTDTNDDSIRRNAMRCISPKNEIQIMSIIVCYIWHVAVVRFRNLWLVTMFANLTTRASLNSAIFANISE